MTVSWTWSAPQVSSDNTILCMTGDQSGKYVFAGGFDVNSNPCIFYTLNSGGTWSGVIQVGSTGYVVGLACSNDGSILYAVINGSSGGLYVSLNHGSTWSQVTTSSISDNNLSAICCDHAGNNVIVTTNKAAGGGGKTWYCNNPLSNPTWQIGDTTDQNWTSIAVNGDVSYFFALASDNGGTNPGSPGLYRSTNGINWEIQSNIFDNNQTWSSVTCANKNSSVFVACTQGVGGNTSGNVYITTNPSSNGSWVQITAPSNPYTKVGLSPDGTQVYASAGSHGLYYGDQTSIQQDTSSTPLGSVSCFFINPAGRRVGLPDILALNPSNSGFVIYRAVYTSYNCVFTIDNVTTSSLTITNFRNLNGGTYMPSIGDVMTITNTSTTTYATFTFTSSASTLNGTYTYSSFTPSTFVPTQFTTYNLVVTPVDLDYAVMHESFIYYGNTPLCFKEGSQILCLVDGVETYIPVETMTPGTLVKTSLDGYKPVAIIGSSKVYNPANGTKSIHHLVKCTPAKYPELTHDLILTGAHSILVNDITDKQRSDLMELNGRIFITDDKYRLMACLDDRSEPYEMEGLFNIWHFALEHEKYTWNYGVYANGLLVETSSLRMMKEFSGMNLLN